MMQINSSEIPISYELKNELIKQPGNQPGVIKPYKKDKIAIIASHLGYKFAPENIFNSMFKEFMTNKYTSINQANPNQKIEVTLKDFWIEYFTDQSGGSQFAVAMIGGEINYTIKAKANVLVKVVKNGEEFSKNIISSAEDLFVTGVGTGTSSSNIYKGNNSAQAKVGYVTNSVFNKVIMMTNKFLDNPSGIKEITKKSSDGYDELKKLKSLFDEGILTKEEFEAKKKQILGL